MEEEKLNQPTPETSSEPVSEPVPEPVDAPTPEPDTIKTPEIPATKPATKPNNAFFKFRYILSLITGWSFYGLLTSLVVNIAYGLFRQETMLYSGEGAATLLASFVIITVLHIVLNWSVRGERHQEQKGKVLPIIYSVPLGISVCVFLFLLLSPLFQLVLGFGADLDIKDFGVQCVTSVTMIAWIAFAIANEFNIKNLFNRKVYAIVASVVALIAIILFIIIPVNILRGKEYDRYIMDDFSMIRSSIDEYANDHYKLPKTLNILKNQDELKNPLSSYDYKPDTSVSGNNTRNCKNSSDSTNCITTYRGSVQLKYQLCATFHAADHASYKEHEKGYDCIDYTTNVYDYRYDYNDAEIEDADIKDEDESSES